MSRGKHTEAQMIGALKLMEAGRKAEDVLREMGLSKHTLCAWKAKYGGIDLSKAQEAKQLRDQNTRLRKPLRAPQQHDEEAQRLLHCGQFLAQMFASGTFQDDAGSTSSSHLGSGYLQFVRFSASAEITADFRVSDVAK